MKSDEEILEEIIKDGTVLELDTWPDTLKRMLARLEAICNDSFPKPTAADLLPPPPLPQPLTHSQASTLPDHRSPSPSRSPTPASTPAVPPPTATPATPSLHPDDAAVLTSLLSTLSTFTAAPPHTIQRLAELLRAPNAHYKSLPKYLRALQRVLSVTSPSTTFPLPQNPTEALTNGHSSGGLLGSDESLGGALLTPIPWLTGGRPEDAGVATNGVSQGELLRQEQELNIVPAAQVEGQHTRGESEGPPGINAEDVGPQPEGTVFPDPPRTEEEAVSGAETKEEKGIEKMDVDTKGEDEVK